MSSSNHYDLLGVPHNATVDEIKKAYRKLALKYHPDTGTEKNDEAMKNLNFIYSVLSDPNQRKSYDDSIAYEYRSESGQKAKDHKHYEAPEPEAPEDYSVAVHVNGIEAIDSAGVKLYVNVGDFLYYKVTTTKRFLFFSYTGSDYYRTRVLKIFSKKRNSFRKVPLFVVAYDNFEHIIFEEDFRAYWLNESGFNRLEKKKAMTTFTLGLGLLVLITYKLLTIS